eukprot:4481709-Pleurochrysis_carterae.AAC.1
MCLPILSARCRCWHACSALQDLTHEAATHRGRLLFSASGHVRRWHVHCMGMPCLGISAEHAA